MTNFNHSGIIDLTANSVVGDVLVISGGRTAGANSGGVFVANGGALKLNAVLDAGGGNNSKADMLVLDSTRLGSAPTGITVVNMGGQGVPFTAGSGIALVEVLNKPASAAGVFTLATPAVAGAYEYLLYHGGDANNGGDPADGNWYLRSRIVPPPPPPPPPPPAPPAPAPVPLHRPEVGAYLSNERQAGAMFLHSLHDRLGEPQWIEGQGFDPKSDKPRSGWLRVANQRTDSTSSNGVFGTETNSTLLQGGGDLARWTVGGDESRLHVGAMLGYGEVKTDATAQYNERQARGKVDGWSVGGYSYCVKNEGIVR